MRGQWVAFPIEPLSQYITLKFVWFLELEENLQVFYDSQSVRFTWNCVDETLLRQSESIQLWKLFDTQKNKSSYVHIYFIPSCFELLLITM